MHYICYVMYSVKLILSRMQMFVSIFCPISRKKPSENMKFLTTSRPFSYGIRKFDIGNTFSCCSNYINANHFMIVRRENMHKCTCVCAQKWEKCNGRTRRHCAHESLFSYRGISKTVCHIQFGT